MSESKNPYVQQESIGRLENVLFYISKFKESHHTKRKTRKIQIRIDQQTPEAEYLTLEQFIAKNFQRAEILKTTF